MPGFYIKDREASLCSISDFLLQMFPLWCVKGGIEPTEKTPMWIGQGFQSEIILINGTTVKQLDREYFLNYFFECNPKRFIDGWQ